MLAENPRGSAGSTCSRLDTRLTACLQSPSDITESLITDFRYSYLIQITRKSTVRLSDEELCKQFEASGVDDIYCLMRRLIVWV